MASEIQNPKTGKLFSLDNLGCSMDNELTYINSVTILGSGLNQGANMSLHRVFKDIYWDYKKTNHFISIEEIIVNDTQERINIIYINIYQKTFFGIKVISKTSRSYYGSIRSVTFLQ